MLTYLVLGAGIGFVAGVSPGPVLTLVVSETLRGGWARGAAIALGPLLADGPILLLAVLLVAQLPPWLVPAMSMVGGIFLLYLGLTSIAASRRTTRHAATRTLSLRGGLLRGLLARALSPNPYLFWLLVGGPLLVQATRDGAPSATAFLVGYYATIVGSNVALALVLGRYVGMLSDRVYRALLLISGVLLAAYGAVLVGRGADLRSR
jgi:threonine/homoserine/homoserine lactone efflux protein